MFSKQFWFRNRHSQARPIGSRVPARPRRHGDGARSIARVPAALPAALAALALCAPVSAQLVLEEVIVTATKRSESLQSLPLSVSAISGDDLRDRGAVDFFDYAVAVPNLSFGAATDGILSNRSVSLRGIQGINTTGFYIDDTPIAETIDPRILDLERVEVLRGPSGTLYGARSLGGTIRHITRRPDPAETSGWLNASISSPGQSDGMNTLVSGSVNLSLGDSAALILSGLQDSQAGVFDRHVGTISNHLSDPAALTGPADSVREDVDELAVTAAQAYLLLRPGDRLSIAPRVLYQKTELDGFPLADVEPGNFQQNRDFDVDEGGYDEWTLATLNIEYATDSGHVHLRHVAVRTRNLRNRVERSIHQLPAGPARRRPAASGCSR